MQLAFIDVATAYTAATPYRQALGGSQSAVCYLAAALARRGVGVHLINQWRTPTVAEGVANLPPEALDDAAALKHYDALILNGRWTPMLAEMLKKRTAAPLIGWMHEAAFQAPWVLPLPELAGLVFVSHWQRRVNAAQIPAHAQAVVIGHGIAPPFQALAATPVPALRVAYVGSSKRGLFYLPAILPRLHQAYPDATFQIYSDCVVSLAAAENQAMQQRLAALAGVTHVGAVDQASLARQLGQTSLLLSPNTYPETFCISLAEAMAAGLGIVCTDRAALPETAAGFAHLVEVAAKDHVDDAPGTLDVTAFTAAARTALAHLPFATRAAQIDYAKTHYDWDVQATRWLDYLRGVC